MNIQRLKRNEIKDVVNNLKYTFHAKKRVNERLAGGLCHVNDTIREMALNMNFAYVNTDGFINLALSKYTYLVVKPIERGNYLCITFKEPSHNGYTIYDKYEMAKKGIGR